jgi:hypothetical protein
VGEHHEHEHDHKSEGFSRKGDPHLRGRKRRVDPSR